MTTQEHKADASKGGSKSIHDVRILVAATAVLVISICTLVPTLLKVASVISASWWWILVAALVSIVITTIIILVVVALMGVFVVREIGNLG